MENDGIQCHRYNNKNGAVYKKCLYNFLAEPTLDVCYCNCKVTINDYADSVTVEKKLSKTALRK